MTQPYNALYGPPQAPVDNALYYDDTQGMPRSRPADPLRWAAEYIGQNKDLPAPQFFMDPRALSARNMLHSALNTSANWLDGTRDTSRIGPEEVISPLGLGFGVSAASSAKNAMQKVAKTPERIASDYGATAARYPSERLDGFEIRRTADSKAGGIKYELFDGDKPMGNLLIDAPRHLQPNPMDAVIDHAGGASFKKIERRQPIAGTVTRIEVDDSLKGKGYGSKLLDVAEGDLKRAGAILHPGDTSMTQDFMNLYAKRDPKMMKDALRRMDLGPNDDPSLMFDRAMTYRQRRDQGGSAMADNAKGSAPGTIINSINQDFAGLSKEQKIAVAREMFPGAHHASLKTSKDVERWIEESYFDEMRRTSVLGTSADDARSAYSNQLRDAIAKARGGGSVLADNAKGSAPGVVVNSMAEGGGIAARLKSAMGNEEAFTAELQGLQGMSVPELKKLASDFTGAPAHTIRNKQDALDAITRRHRNIMDTTAKAQFTKGFTIEASPYASAPGLAANSTQQDDQGVMSILRRYGLAD